MDLRGTQCALFQNIWVGHNQDFEVTLLYLSLYLCPLPLPWGAMRDIIIIVIIISPHNPSNSRYIRIILVSAGLGRAQRGFCTATPLSLSHLFPHSSICIPWITLTPKGAVQLRHHHYYSDPPTGAVCDARADPGGAQRGL